MHHSCYPVKKNRITLCGCLLLPCDYLANELQNSSSCLNILIVRCLIGTYDFLGNVSIYSGIILQLHFNTYPKLLIFTCQNPIVFSFPGFPPSFILIILLFLFFFNILYNDLRSFSQFAMNCLKRKRKCFPPFFT